MNDRTLDRLIATTTPFTTREVDLLPLRETEQNLRDAILTASPQPAGTTLSAEVPTQLDYVQSGLSTTRRPRRLVVACVAAAAVVVLVGVGAATMSRSTPPNGFAGAPLTTVPPAASTSASPRFLLTAPGWRVDRVDESIPGSGEMTFVNGDQQVDLHWSPVDQPEAYLDDRDPETDIEGPVTIAGQEGVLSHYNYEGSTRYTALWTEGGHGFELDGDPFASAHAYRRMIDSLEPVTEETWLAALPASSIAPADAPAAVEAILADIPVPAGVDATAIGQIDIVKDRYQLIAQVTGQVACGWIDQWVAATDAGESSRAAEALAAMTASRDWSALQEIADQGDWAEAIWGYADAMAAAAPGTTGPIHPSLGIGC